VDFIYYDPFGSEISRETFGGAYLTGYIFPNFDGSSAVVAAEGFIIKPVRP